MKPNFCVITTTFNRPDVVLRCVTSVQTQTYTNWQHIVVIDDPKSDYNQLKSSVQFNPRITILTNTHNLGKNASVNLVFEYLRKQEFSGYVVFLDDDDWLTPNCLADFADSIHKSNHHWLVSQRRSTINGESFTKNTTGKNIISYQYECLFKKNFTGDATHCINFSTTKNIAFPLSVKNAEEWLYFAHLSTIHPNFMYLQITGTLSEGYAASGLTDQYHQNHESRKNALALLKEVWHRQLFSPLILGYVFFRVIRSIF